MSTANKWFDYEGESKFWSRVPLRAVKKAFFKKGSQISALAKIVVNSVTYDFTKTAVGGAVIVPPDYSVIELIAPDGRVDYNVLLTGKLGDSFDGVINALETNPIPAWDKFVTWLVETDVIKQMGEGLAHVYLRTIDGVKSTEVSIPDFSNVTNMATFLGRVKSATQNTHDQLLTEYQVDDSAFGWALYAEHLPTEEGYVHSQTIGFLFRE